MDVVLARLYTRMTELIPKMNVTTDVLKQTFTRSESNPGGILMIFNLIYIL